MHKQQQIAKAVSFLALHHDAKLLVLPNVWDPLGARLLENLGYPAVATASAAVSFSLGYDDGELIGFEAMLDVVERIARSVSVPMSADIERGYSDSAQGVGDNVRRVIDAGVVGINIEDSISDGGSLRPVEEQRERIESARHAAQDTGIPLVINTRIDTFLEMGDRPREERFEETLSRAREYLEAGADCIYPIGLDDIESLTTLHSATKAPINVYARAGTPSMAELEAAGVSRLSLGPGLLKAGFTAVKRVAEGLLRYESYDSFTKDTISSADIHTLISRVEEA